MARIPLKTLPIEHRNGLQLGTDAELEIDVELLRARLKEAVRGDVQFDAGTRAMYAQDASNYRMPPIGVVCPHDADDVAAAVAVAREFDAPVLPRGGGTSIPGQGNNAALMLDFSRHMSGVLSIDTDDRTADVLPGTVLDELQAAALRHGLMFGPDPATHSRCTLGGMIGNNSCGMHSVLAGRTSDNVEELEVVCYDGGKLRLAKGVCEGDGRAAEIERRLKELANANAEHIRKRFPKIPRRVSGYNLDDLLPENGCHFARSHVGSEGTCATITRAKLKLIERPRERVLLAIGFPDQPAAGEAVMECLSYKPMACEGLDSSFFEKLRRKGFEVRNLELLPQGNTWLFVEFGADSIGQAKRQAELLQAALKAPSSLLSDRQAQKNVWGLRESGLGGSAKVPGMPENWEGWEDTAVSPSVLGPYLRDFRALMQQYSYEGAFYGHYGDGCVHVRIDFDLRSAEGIAKYREFVEDGADLVIRYGGSLSGEHGDGQAKGELLERMFGKELIDAFSEFKGIWDPAWRMNPGKLIAPQALDEHLKLGAGYRVPEPATHFSYKQDDGSFGEATLRCVGAGVCRRKEGGLMCPSYMVTGEEKHSTRGRARLLFEMLRGDVIQEGWQSEEVKEALDLCLSCKGCKSECPVQVDMATYKAEFLSHYYENRRRPIQALLFGDIHRWARLGSIWPWLANHIARGLKSLVGIAPEREPPQLAPYSFKRWLRTSFPRTGNGDRVILWADTFNDHFHPDAARAAYLFLSQVGFRVEVPFQDLCCGRPYYDWGMLDQAKATLTRVLDALAEDLDGSTPIIVLEPGCASVFRDELLGLFPDNEAAAKLAKQTKLLSEFLIERDVPLPRVNAKAIVHMHCHHRSIFGVDAYNETLARMGIEPSSPEAGCCGMAGAFGFEAGARYEVSAKLAERALAPAVRDSDPEALILADGFSCREQIRQSTGQHAIHLSEALLHAQSGQGRQS